ncbi:MAG: hypothetical protein AAF587_30820 [Bacteroidota bacterium]
MAFLKAYHIPKSETNQVVLPSNRVHMAEGSVSATDRKQMKRMHLVAEIKFDFGQNGNSNLFTVHFYQFMRAGPQNSVNWGGFVSWA